MVASTALSEKTTTTKKNPNRRHEEEEAEAEEKVFEMAAGPERSRGIHYGPALPVFKWGRTKQLRFANIDDYASAEPAAERGDHVLSGDHVVAGDRRRSPSFRPRKEGESVGKRSETERRRRFLFDPEKQFGRSERSLFGGGAGGEGDDEDGIEAVRTKLMLDFQTEVDRMKVAFLREGNDEIEPPPPPAKSSPKKTTMETEAEIRPWNLRTRRAAQKDANGGANAAAAGRSVRIDDRKPNGSPPRLRSAAAAGGAGEKRKEDERRKFSVSLSKEEIVEDFFSFTGAKPNRRPKKRPRSVQKQLNSLFPGMWLTEITPEMYNVTENLGAKDEWIGLLR
ncbi:hypothetical protein AKJ16_DCAP02643 [Drosera capensis]